MIDITDEKTNGIIYETFDTPTSLFFAKTPVHSAEHKGSYRIFADLIFADAVQYRENRESLVPRKFPSLRYYVGRFLTEYGCFNQWFNYMSEFALNLFLGPNHVVVSSAL